VHQPRRLLLLGLYAAALAAPLLCAALAGAPAARGLALVRGHVALVVAQDPARFAPGAAAWPGYPGALGLTALLGLVASAPRRPVGGPRRERTACSGASSSWRAPRTSPASGSSSRTRRAPGSCWPSSWRGQGRRVPGLPLCSPASRDDYNPAQWPREV